MKFEEKSKINPEQYPIEIDVALKMYCLDCEKFFLINGNCTCKVFCEHCESDKVDFAIYYKHLQYGKK